MIAIEASERKWLAGGATQLFEGDEVMLISDQGTMVRPGRRNITVWS